MRYGDVPRRESWNDSAPIFRTGKSPFLSIGFFMCGILDFCTWSALLVAVIRPTITPVIFAVPGVGWWPIASSLPFRVWLFRLEADKKIFGRPRFWRERAPFSRPSD